MFRSSMLVLALFCSILALPAGAHERYPYSMEVLVDGIPLQAHHARGKTYVEAAEGREYAIRLRNHTASRVAVALAVDGLNSIDAKTTTAPKARKWILAPYQTITIEGWQTGPATARRFFFTTEDESYGAWLGKTRNLGLVSAAFFREKARQPIALEQGYEERRESSSRPGRRGDADAPGPSAGSGKRSKAEAAPDDHAATGIGREVDHRVVRVEFDAEPAPAAVVELRYEYRDALVSLGVLPAHPDPLTRREAARGFEELDFAPVPVR